MIGRSIGNDLSKSTTTVQYILAALVPYTEANLKLVFKPSRFFADLEKISKRNNQTIKNAYYQLVKDGYVANGGAVPALTAKGARKLRLYQPELLDGAELFVIFDVPEQLKAKRQHLRLLLKELKFRQIQKSVWASPYDHREYFMSEVNRLDIQEYVLVYEARPVTVSAL